MYLFELLLNIKVFRNKFLRRETETKMAISTLISRANAIEN